MTPLEWFTLGFITGFGLCAIASSYAVSRKNK